MAYTGEVKNKQKIQIKEGSTIEVVTVTDPDLISAAADPLLSITIIGNLGWVKKGTIQFNGPTEYAEIRSDTPDLLVRRDPISVKFSMQAELFQQSNQLFGLVWTLDTEDGAFDMAFVGHDKPTPEIFGYLITTKLVDGTPAYRLMFAGFSSAENLQLNASGTEHVTYQFMAHATQHDTFEALNDPTFDTRDYGLIWTGTTP